MPSPARSIRSPRASMNTSVRCPKPRPSVTDPTPTTSPASAHHQRVIERLAAIDLVKASGSPRSNGSTRFPASGPPRHRTTPPQKGPDMTRFPPPAHLVSWAKLCPRTIQSGPITRGGRTGKGNPYLKGVLGDAATAAAKTTTFLGERYRRIVKRRGKLKALVAVARSLLVVVWHLLADPAARFHDLGADYHTNRIVTQRRVRNHIAQLTALGYRVTLEPAA